MIIKDIEKLIRLVEQSEIAELEWEKNKERIKIRKVSETVMVSPPSLSSTAAPVARSVPQEKESASAAKVEMTRNKEVLSPFVGTFYAAASPDAPKYVEVGQRVKKGDVLCIIEAMKIMNEIEAEFPGKILSVLVKDGQPVQYGQPLFTIEP